MICGVAKRLAPLAWKRSNGTWQLGPSIEPRGGVAHYDDPVGAGLSDPRAQEAGRGAGRHPPMSGSHSAAPPALPGQRHPADALELRRPAVAGRRAG